VLAGNLEWWNIVPHESLCSLDSEVDDEACVGLVDSDGIEDFLDKSEWLEELRELNNIQEASFKTKDPNNSDEVLFSNSQLTVKETVILILAIITRHRLSGVAVDDMLALMHLICPKENRLPKDAKEVFSFFQTEGQRIVTHFYCPNKKCRAYVSTMLPKQENCSQCNFELNQEAMFLEIPVQEQLKAVLTGTCRCSTYRMFTINHIHFVLHSTKGTSRFMIFADYRIQNIFLPKIEKTANQRKRP